MYINPKGKILRHADRLAEWQAGRVFPPIGIEIDLSNRCNLGCKFCHFAYTHTRGYLAGSAKIAYDDMGDLMDLDLLYRVADEMVVAGVKSVTFTGGGEPTVHPKFAEAMKIVTDAGLELGLYTNAVLIDWTMAEAIKRMCKWVVVSLDEPYHDAYREAKQADKFNEACDGIRDLVAASKGAVIGASFLVGAHHNLDDLRRMWELSKRLGVDYVEYRPRIAYDEANPSVASEDTAWVRNAIDWLNKIKIFDWDGSGTKIDARFEQFQLYADYKRDYPACYGILFTGVVSPNGKMWKCVNRRGFPDSCLGDLNTEHFAEIWARQKPQTDFAKCRVLCRADVLNRTLAPMAVAIPHENFV